MVEFSLKWGLNAIQNETPTIVKYRSSVKHTDNSALRRNVRIRSLPRIQQKTFVENIDIGEKRPFFLCHEHNCYFLPVERSNNIVTHPSTDTESADSYQLNEDIEYRSLVMNDVRNAMYFTTASFQHAHHVYKCLGRHW